MSINPSLPDFASRAIAALNTGNNVVTPVATISHDSHSHDRPFVVAIGNPYCDSLYRFPSAPLAVAFLRSL